MVLNNTGLTRSLGNQWGRVGSGACVAGAQLSLPSFDSRVSRTRLVSTIARSWFTRRYPLGPAKSGSAGWFHGSGSRLMGTPIWGVAWYAPFLI